MSKRMFSVFSGLIFLILASCSEVNDDSPFTNELEAVNFTLDAPSDWMIEMDQGTDTFVGRIFNASHTIYYDQGFLSFKGLEDIVETSNTISLEKLKIDGISAIIHKDKTEEGIRTSIYIDAGDDIRMNRLYIFNPENETLVLNILKTHKFKPNLNPI